VPAVDIEDGRAGALLQFNPFPAGFGGVAHVRLREDSGVLQLVASDPRHGTVLLDAQTLSPPSGLLGEPRG
jgi:hypothetical protein